MVLRHCPIKDNIYIYIYIYFAPSGAAVYHAPRRSKIYIYIYILPQVGPQFITPLGKETMLRLERDAWSIVKRLPASKKVVP